MKKQINNWLFEYSNERKKLNELEKNINSEVSIPHTWNNYDGQNGEENYKRGYGYYIKKLLKPDIPEDYKIYLEFEGVNSIANVFINNELVTTHEGGYSTFNVEITDYFTDDIIEVVVEASNVATSHVYPQVADFTFYGGMYRKVNLVTLPQTHFNMNKYGAKDIFYTSKIDKSDAQIKVESSINNIQWSDQLRTFITDADGQIVSECYAPANKENITNLTVFDVHLWNGTKDPYLYTLTTQIIRGNDVIDEVVLNLGIREYYVDPSQGFFLNGESYPLRGVSRHQDKCKIGNALSLDDHIKDADIIKELGANTIRLAHYQHSEDFYNICDKYGFIVWAEIPFISVMNSDEKAHENAVSQLKELIYQNRNHPSIVCWGISNEITIGGNKEGLTNNLKYLNTLVHDLDASRLSTIAQVSMLPIDSDHNFITDVVSYNHYFGWYGGTFEQNEEWFDNFHSTYPEIPIGISEYGCEGIINWHSDNPINQDYTEEYQTAYHEYMAKMINERQYLWATHIWNMFDFGADNRNEGGIKGRNNKGLVSFDRKLKKDSFYVYKSYWSDSPFVHIAEKKFSHRDKEKIDIKVYSNQSKVSLYVDGEFIDEISGANIFKFKNITLNNNDWTTVVAKSTDSKKDVAYFKLVDKLPDSYTKPREEEQISGAKNWFEEVNKDNIKDLTFTFEKEYFSIEDTVEDILNNSEAAEKVLAVITSITGMNVKASTFKMMNDLKLKELDTFINEGVDSVNMKLLNSELQKIKK